MADIHPENFNPVSRADVFKNLMADGHLAAADVAFDALVLARSLRERIAESEAAYNYTEAPKFMYTPCGPFPVTLSGNMWSPVINWVRGVRAQHLEAKGQMLMPRD